MAVKRFLLLVSLALLPILLLSGCSARLGAGETAAAAAEAPLALDLPALTIDIDANGAPSIAGAPLSSFASLAPGLADFSLGSDLVSQLMQANIQHIQISTLPDGLRILVNGAALPSLRWDEERLTNLSELVDLLGPSVPSVVKAVLPIISDVGVGVTLRFPLAQGADVIPLQVEPATVAAAREAVLAQLGKAPVIRIPVVYDIEGNYTVQGVSDAEWQALTGAPFGQLKLDAELVKNAVAAGVRTATVRTDAEGIHIALNDKELPVLGWGEGELLNLVKLAAGAGVLQGAGLDADALVGLLEALLPVIEASDVSIHVTFPAAQ